MNNKIKLLQDIKVLQDTKTAIDKELISLKKLLDFYRDCYKDAKQSGDFHTVIMASYIIFSLYDNIKSLRESYKDTCEELIKAYTQEIISIQNKEVDLIDELNKLYKMNAEINCKITLIREEVNKCTGDLNE